MSKLGKHWRVYSSKDIRFEAVGYTEPPDDYRDDATKALELLSKSFKEPIPTDVKLSILGTSQ